MEQYVVCCSVQSICCASIFCALSLVPIAAYIVIMLSLLLHHRRPNCLYIVLACGDSIIVVLLAVFQCMDAVRRHPTDRGKCDCSGVVGAI